MADTLLPKKAGQDNAVAKSDDHHDALAADPTVTAFPAGSTFGSSTSSTGGTSSGFGTSTSSNSAFGSSTAGGFGSSSNFGSSGSGASAFGSSTGSFGSSTSTTNGFGGTSGGFGTTSTGGFGGGGIGGTSPMGMGTNQSGLQVIQNQGEAIKSSGGAMQEGAENQVALDKDATDWINKKWRPAMGWVYMLTCTCDFVLFPILWSLLQALSHGQVTSQWQPLTLQGAGLYHIAMGAVLGIAAYGRTKEKVAGAA